MDAEDYVELRETVWSLLGLLAGLGFLYFLFPFLV